jgi:hypothetical protein
MMQEDGARRGSRVTKLVLTVVLLVLLYALLWGSDRITLQGERTIFTVDCAGGVWEGARCTGYLVPGKRYAFRASKARQEVLYWIRGSEAPSGRYTDCSVTDRDNWSCNVVIDGEPRTIAFEMVKGQPTRVGSGLVLPYHSVPKWKWWLMDLGFSSFRDASN